MTVTSKAKPSAAPASVVITYTVLGARRGLLLGQEQRGTCIVSSHAPGPGHTLQQCTVQILTSPAAVTFSRAAALLIRRGHVVAGWTATRLAGGRLRLVLHSPSPPDVGTYTLRLTPPRGGSVTIAFRLA